MNTKKYENPPKEFRAVPFWSWNDRLEPELIRYQIGQMDEAGLGGYFMHARTGLATGYMGEDWMKAIETGIDEGKKHGMSAWGYDEEGYPSGYAGGAVQAAGEKYWMKWIECSRPEGYEYTEGVLAVFTEEDGKFVRQPTDSVIPAEKKPVVISGKTSPAYIDPINPESIALFIKLTHEKYYERFGDEFGKTLPGFFTDEPQFGLAGIPWTDTLADTFMREYGYDVLDNAPYLYCDDPAGDAFRHDFWRLINRLYTENFIKQLGGWCRDHGCRLTGHVMGEDNIMSQMHMTGGVMPGYEYFDIPGIDWLGRGICSDVLPKQVSSVAAQLGKKRVLSEMFGLTGWDVSPEQLKWIAEWQFVNGISFICQHLESYTLRGVRKRDFPPSLFCQLPWWKEYRKFIDYFARLSMLLTEGDEVCPVLVLHPISSAWTRFNKLDLGSIYCFHDSLETVVNTLGDCQVGYHLGDEQLMEKYGSVNGNRLTVGRKSYTAVVLPELVSIESPTLALLDAFMRNGGNVIAAGTLPKYVDGRENAEALEYLSSHAVKAEGAEALCAALEKSGAVLQKLTGDRGRVRVMRRDRDDGTLLYIVNTDNERGRTFTLTSGAKSMTLLDVEALTETALHVTTDGKNSSAEISLLPAGSAVILLDSADPAEYAHGESERVTVTLPEELEIEKCDINSLTVDSCEYRVDGGEWRPEKAVILISDELLKMRRPCDFELKYHFNISCDPKLLGRLYLAGETVNSLNMKVNGHPITHDGKSWWRDSAFQKCEITDFVRQGVNEVTASGHYFQRDEVFDILYGGGDIMGTRFNRLTYDTELESIYILGDFGVYDDGGFTPGERNALFCRGDFRIDMPNRHVKRGSVTGQGYAFFSGRMTFGFDITADGAGKPVYLKYSQRAAVTNICVNGKPVRTVWRAPYETDITEYLVPGVNHVTVEAVSGNRCLLGPHHHIFGETYSPGPWSFTDTGGWCEGELNGKPIWRDGFCMVTFGVY